MSVRANPRSGVLPTTTVTFPSGALEGSSTVVAVHPLPDGRTGVVTEATPFHPVDHTWPDQPGDVGTLGGRPVVDTLTAATDGATTAVDTDIPVRRGEDGWSWLVLHVLAGEAPEPGEPVELAVEAGHRAALSAGHTGCHLVAFALNAALADRWRKEVRTDSLGNPDFDSLAMQSSRILPGGSVDSYRVGKSLRKKGFTPGDLAADAPALADAVNARLRGWLAERAPVRVLADGPLLTDARRWSCALAAGEASVACGGTHIGSLAELASLQVTVDLAGDGTELAVHGAAELA